VRRRVGIALLALVAACLAAYRCARLAGGGRTDWGEAPRERLGDRGLEFGGALRTYRLHLPPAARSDRPPPLVMVFHGDGSTGGQIAAGTQMDAAADRWGFVAAYPDALHQHWNDDLLPDGRHPDDVGYIRALIARLAAERGIDRKRVYAAGFSNGGFFVQRLACEMTGELAAIGAVAGTMSAELAARCAPAAPISVLMIQGTLDPFVPYDGGPAPETTGEPDLSAPETVRRWLATDRCAGTPPPPSAGRKLPGSAGPELRRWAWGPCAEGTEVVLYDVIGGGHAWPRAVRAAAGDRAGRSIVDATDLVAEFFAAHARP
jgi:polyhydroxybutyrate depolymerase